MTVTTKISTKRAVTALSQKYLPVDMAVDMGDIDSIKGFDIEGI